VSLVRLRPVWMTNHPPSVLWHCWLGHQTCKNRRPYNLYCVGADEKNHAQSINQCVWCHFVSAVIFITTDNLHIRPPRIQLCIALNLIRI